eukprot:CAMPEP_0116081312 /NCGR_PEP_ID=MMETSP0327-20121206/2131_1 /TAXON_ID=44447 /ORGANISM="Pseudo-nitzschia delicatissima, Strain B596" /LENGTH=531 /DNA_ID=CAMNT_0003572041 /DNA_START=69 /DNA_END=1664 /DNA_ORIENTATION=+
MTGKQFFPSTRQLSLLFVVALSLFRLEACIPAVNAEVEQPTCDWSSACETTESDPALKEFTYDVGYGPQTMLAYVEPELDSFYQKPGQEPKQRKYRKSVPQFDGFAAKFINMSNKHLDFYWESAAGGEAYFMAHYEPFSSDGTGSFPTHRFFFATSEEPDVKLNLWIMGDYPENLYVYDPYKVEDDPEQTESNLSINLDEDEREQYDLWKKTLLFNEQYKAFTGRSYLANYGEDGPRAHPMHFMWRADYFGQQHWVTTRETHFKKMPPTEELGRVPEFGMKRVLKDSDPRKFQEYRALDETTQEPLLFMNMTMTVLSCAPRVFEIQNFLSPEEVQHVLELATGISLNKSRTGNTNDEDSSSDTRTRTSRNSWIQREKSPIVDTIYRRAADLTRIDEALLRQRSDTELPSLGHRDSLAETLQLVHYDVDQEYTSHHDFGYSHIEETDQSARFATILFYLNDDMEGGETAFPRWINGHSFRELRVKPELGKAILFYDQLPDGNFDDFSQHAAKPIIEGEKWLINLWIWDPVYN